MAEQIRKTTGRSQQKTVVVPEMGRLRRRLNWKKQFWVL